MVEEEKTLVHIILLSDLKQNQDILFRYILYSRGTLRCAFCAAFENGTMHLYCQHSMISFVNSFTEEIGKAGQKRSGRQTGQVVLHPRVCGA